MSMTVSKILALRESKLQRVREDLSRKKNAVVEAESEEAAAREEAENYSLQMKNIETRLLESCVDEKKPQNRSYHDRTTPCGDQNPRKNRYGKSTSARSRICRRNSKSWRTLNVR